ncbi:MAG: universal stress protein [Gemmobacter sp.]
MYQNILVTVAFDAETDPKRGLRAANVLAAEGARVTFLHVMAEPPSGAIAYMPEGYEMELERSIRAELDALADGAANGTVAVLRGHAARMILEWADTAGIDCIVIDSHRPGLADYFLGSTAARVVRHAKCSVHVLR